VPVEFSQASERSRIGLARFSPILPYAINLTMEGIPAPTRRVPDCSLLGGFVKQADNYLSKRAGVQKKESKARITIKLWAAKPQPDELRVSGM
jgi:hypothetical protein